MEKTVTTFDDIEIEKQKLHQHKRHISIKNIDINKLIIPSMTFDKTGFKSFIGYKQELCIMLSALFFQLLVHI